MYLIKFLSQQQLINTSCRSTGMYFCHVVLVRSQYNLNGPTPHSSIFAWNRVCNPFYFHNVTFQSKSGYSLKMREIILYIYNEESAKKLNENFFFRYSMRKKLNGMEILWEEKVKMLNQILYDNRKYKTNKWVNIFNVKFWNDKTRLHVVTL